MRVGIDCDGVIANFSLAYGNLTIEVAGKDLFPSDWKSEGWLPPVWNWPEHFGYSDVVMKEVWRRIKSDPIFWFKLAPLPGAMEFLARLNESPELDSVYFITDRPGISPQLQTQLWLGENGYSGPNVIISRKGKGSVAAALDLTHYIDDKGENVEDVRTKSPGTKVYCLTTPYNAGFSGRAWEDVVRVGSIGEFGDLLGLPEYQANQRESA